MDTDAAKQLKELREQNARLKRLLADAELEKDALREIAKGEFCARRPSARAVDMFKQVKSKGCGTGRAASAISISSTSIHGVWPRPTR